MQPLAAGALVLAIDTDFDGCMRIVQELAEREGVYLANSMNYDAVRDALHAGLDGAAP